MWSEIYRPEFLDGVIGHADIKQQLTEYLTAKPYTRVIVLHGPPGIGKTTIALAAIRTFGLDPLELNASQSMRSFEDVERLTQSCRHTRSISSLLRGDQKPMCLLLDEIDGSDPHAQRKLVEWLIGPDRKIPVLLTCNEVPRVLKNQERILVLRCFPPKPADLQPLFPKEDIHKLAKRFKHDVRRVLQFLQYGDSDPLPSIPLPTECSPEVFHMLKQTMYIREDPLLKGFAKESPRDGPTHSKEHAAVVGV